MRESTSIGFPHDRRRISRKDERRPGGHLPLRLVASEVRIINLDISESADASMSFHRGPKAARVCAKSSNMGYE